MGFWSRPKMPDVLQADLAASALTQAARQAVELAAQDAAGRHAAHIEPEHLLLGILAAQDKIVAHALAAAGVAPSHIGEQMGAQLAPSQPEPGPLPALGPAAKRVIHYAVKEAQHLGAGHVDVVHLLLGLLYEEEGLAIGVLQAAGLSLYDLRQAVLSQPRPRSGRAGVRLGGVIRPSPVFLIPLGAMLGSGAGLYLDPAEALVRPLTTLFIISGWIVSLCLHEFGHALAAYLGGDEAVRDAGYLTLNPIKYSHPLLSIVMPLLFLMMGGIGLPGGAVYINRQALRSSTWESIVSAAGPLGTVLFGALIVWPFFLGWEDWVTVENWHFWPALAYLALLQVSALIFNLIPLPPLDGFGIIAPRLPLDLRVRMQMFGNIALMLLFVALWQDGPINQAFWEEVFKTTDKLHIPYELIMAAQDQVYW
jgi:Zn-dependent protease